MGKLKNFLQTKPVFLYLLPVFFVLHGFIENFHYSLANEAIELAAIYLSLSLVFTMSFWLIFRSFYKASFIAFFLMAFNFFFGSAYDFLKTYFSNTIILRYSFIIPFTLLLLIFLILYIKKTKKDIRRLGFFLNVLLLLSITIDLTGFVPKIFKPTVLSTTSLSEEFITCDSCSKPDIYLIIADEYAGATELKDIFSFDNSAFEKQLKSRGFHITNFTKSNYNATVYSMASLFDMNYVNNLEQNTVNHKDMFACQDIIKKNNLLSFLKQNGYQTYNYSPFDFDGNQKYINNPFFPSKKEFYTSQTFINRFLHDLGYLFLSQRKIKAEKDRHKYNNIKIENATKNIRKTKTAKPRFVYTHLSMPHHPYYYDSNGKESRYDIVTYSYPEEKKDYIQYLQYANKKLLNLIDQIKSGTQSNPVIILMSDHGYRQFTEKIDPQYYFMTLNAVLMPAGNYTGFYDGMGNVNQFRIILNAQFGQKLPLLKDSTIFLKE